MPTCSSTVIEKGALNTPPFKQDCSHFLRVLPSPIMPPPSTLRPPPSALRPQGRAPKNAGHQEWPCRDTSLPRNQPCCPGDGSCPRHLRHPRGQLASVGRGFHGGSPQGVRLGFREEARAGGAFLLCLGTLGLCSQPAVSEDGTRTRGGGVRTWVRVLPPLGGS